MVEETSGVSWGGDWKVVHASHAVSGGICIVVWGRDLGLLSDVRYGLKQLQLRAMRVFFGVGVRHSKVSLMMEADAFPVGWLVRVRCVTF